MILSTKSTNHIYTDNHVCIRTIHTCTATVLQQKDRAVPQRTQNMEQRYEMGGLYAKVFTTQVPTRVAKPQEIPTQDTP